MPRTFLTLVVSCAVVLAATGLMPAGPVAAQTPAAAERLAAAIAAMGGEARLNSLTSLTLDSIGHGWALEQSERPEGPWLTIYRQRIETRDLRGRRRRLQNQQRFWSSPSWSHAASIVVADGASARVFGERWAAGSPADVRDMDMTFALAPERLLLTARDAKDLRALPDEKQQGVNQHVVGFTFNAMPCRLFLNAWTHLPTMLEVVRDDGIWGDVTERRWYSFWTLESGGLMYPRQTSVEWNGLPYTDETVQTLTVDAPIDEATFAIPADTRTAFAAAKDRPSGLASLPLDLSRAVPIADWLVQLPGGFNVALVRQPDGVVIVESTTSAGYSEKVMAAAAERFPGLPIKAMITTSDAWPHIAGVREYVAKGTPIHALDLNVSILSRMVEARRTFSPDTLAKAPRAPVFRPVANRAVIGTGDTRMELIPVRGELGERMMLIWFPSLRTLYSSDLIQRGRPGTNTFFMPSMLMEVETVVRREGLDVQQVFGMHLPPTPWANVVAAIAAAKK